MQSSKQKLVLYAALLILGSIICSTAVATPRVFDFLWSDSVLNDAEFLKLTTSRKVIAPSAKNTTARVARTNKFNKADKTTNTFSPAMFATILVGANEEATCPDDGSTLAKYFLCGTGDDRTLSLSASGSSYTWQQLGSGCSFTGSDECPTYDTSCSGDWTTVGNSSTFLLDAGDSNVASEYRVRIDSGTWYHFRVTSNPLDPQLTTKNIICGNAGHIEVTNVPSGYEYSLNSATGPYQDSPFFSITAAGNYQVFTRLKNAPASSCVFPSETVTITEESMTVDVSKTDIVCNGEKGNIGVTVSDGSGFFTYRLYKDGTPFDTFGPNATPNHTFNNLGSGTYTVTVETNDCSITVTDIAGDPITIGNGLSAIDATAYATDSFGCGASSVDITLDVSGGTSPYRYSLDGGATFSSTFASTISFPVTTAGTYNIDIEDVNGCPKSAAVEVQNIPPPTFNVTTEDANCGGANDGRLTVNVTNSNGYALEYSVNNGATFQNSNVFSSLAPGSYDVVVRYQQDTFVCTSPSQNGTIGTPSTISSSASATQNPSCANESGGEITFTVASGGTGPYEYSIGSGFDVGNLVFPGLSEGTYTPQIRDANGCVETLPDIVFNALNKPTDIDFTVSSIDCISGTASVTLAVTDGGAIATYEILAPAPFNNGANPVFTGLSLGSYTFRVTDNGGCSYTKSFAIDDISSIKVTAQLMDNATCVNDTDGRGRFIVDGFSSTYSYQIDANPIVAGETSNMINLNNLAAGSYIITVTDDETSCTESATLTIDEPGSALTLAPTVTPMGCNNNNRGSVSANASGGWGGYEYTLDRPVGADIGPRSNPNFTGLNYPGNYTLTVVDSEGCTDSFSFTLTPTGLPSLVIDTASSDFCFDNANAATINVAASGGDGNYEYRINGGAWNAGGATESFTGLGPNVYTIEVRDGNGCIDTVSRNIRLQTTSTVSIQKELTCSLTGTGDAEILVNLNNGNPPYQSYEVSFNGGAYAAPIGFTGSSFVFTTAIDGTYQFRIIDNENCPAETNVITLNPTEVIVATADVTDPRCGDPTTGSVELVPDTTVGVPPYQYSTDDVTYGNQAVFVNLSPGNYTYFVRDSRGCRIPVNFTVGPPAPGIDANISITPAVCAAPTVEGQIDVTGNTNGVAPFNYTLLDASGTVISSVPSTASTTANFSNIPLGNYTVVTTDAAGCEDRDFVVMTQNQLDLVPVNTTTPPDCTTQMTYVVDIVGGTAPYQIGLVGGALGAPNVDADTHDFTGIVEYGVTYFVEVVDALGCRYIEQIDEIDGPDPLEINATATTASCDPSGNGEITYEITGIPSPADITIQLMNTDTGANVGSLITLTNETIPYNGVFSNLPIGNYQIIVEDTNSTCNASVLSSIIFSAPSISIDSNTNANCNNPNGQLVVRGVNGAPTYTYAIVAANATAPAPGDYSTQNVYDLPPADYDIYLIDGRGCETILEDVTVGEDLNLAPPTVDVTNQCFSVATYNVQVTSPLTTAPGPETTFQYNIGNGFQDSPAFSIANPGTYTITVRNGNGCTSTVDVEVFDFFSITASASSQPSCNNADGVVTVSTTGGSGNFEYVLDDGTSTTTQNNSITDPHIFTNLPPGNFTITVTDLSSNTAPLCSDTAFVEIITVIPPAIDNLILEPVSCNGAGDGSIIVELDSASAIDAPFTYNLYDNTNTQIQSIPDATFQDLSAGIYQVEVVSNRGCRVRSGNVTIIEPSVLQVTPVAPNFTCNPSNNSFSTTTLTIYTDSNGDGSGTPTGNGSYSYSLDDGTPFFDGTNFQSLNTFEIIDNGTDQIIDVIVRDGKGCETREQITILTPTDLTFNFNLLNPITCDATGAGANAGQLEIIIDQGAGNYGVEVLPLGSQPEKLTSGSDRVVWDIDVPGNYIFAVRDIDSGSCLFVTPIYTIPEYNTIEAVIAELNPVSCFAVNDGQLSLEVNNYVGIYNYEVFIKDNTGAETSTGVTGSFDTANPIATPEVITGLPAGNLVVHIEALNTPFCDTNSNTAPVRSPDRALTLVTEQTAPVTCSVPGKGEITATGDGGWTGFEYQLEQETATPGTYTVEAVFSAQNVFSDLSEGNYRVSVRDTGGCIQSENIVLSLPTPINSDIQIAQPLLCPGANDGIIEALNITGGEDLDGNGEEYLFQLNRLDDTGVVESTSGLQESPVFPNLPSGYYTITVLDGWECSFTTPQIFIQDPEPVIAELRELTPPGCGDLGTMDLSVENPVSGMEYFYRRSGTSDAFVSFGGVDVTSVIITIPDIDADPGPFQYDVQNGNGCPQQQSNEIGLDKAQPLVIGLDLVDANIKCDGEETGIIRSEAYGGIGNYTYTLVNNDLGASTNGGVPRMPNSSDIVRSSQSSGIFRDLGPATYWVFAQSSGCITVSEAVIIAPKDPLELSRLEANPVSCVGDADGQIVISARGGTGDIKFSISDTLSEFFEGDDTTAGVTTITFSDLLPGIYQVIVQDEAGCSILRDVEVEEPEQIVVADVSTTPELCINASDGTATLTMQGGTPFVDTVTGATYYETSLNSSDPADFVRNDNMFFDNLAGGGTYVIFVRDANLCETNVIVNIDYGVDLTSEPIIEYGCNGIFPNSTVTVEMTDDSLMADLMFALDVDDISRANASNVFGDLAPNTQHTVYVYHSNGCSTSVDFTLDAYDPLSLIAVKTGPNEITATAEGGFGGYEFFFQDVAEGSNNVFTLNEDDSVTIRVEDQGGCVAEVVMDFDFTGMIEVPNFFTPNGDNENDFWAPNNRDFFPNIEVVIYDRYGRVVAKLDNVSEWDGTYESKEVPTGDYWYVVNANDEEKQQYVGHFTLYR